MWLLLDLLSLWKTATPYRACLEHVHCFQGWLHVRRQDLRDIGEAFAKIQNLPRAQPQRYKNTRSCVEQQQLSVAPRKNIPQTR